MSETSTSFPHYSFYSFKAENLRPTTRLNVPIVEIKLSFHFLAIIVTDPRHYNVIILCNIDCNMNGLGLLNQRLTSSKL